MRALMAADEATVDLEAQEISWDGGSASFDIDPETKHRLLNGLDDIALTLAQEDAIAAYEADRERTGPVTTALAWARVRGWNADAYHRVSGPQVAMSEAVMGRLELRGDGTVLDAGCGSGRVTRLLLDRLPRGRVIAVDASRTWSRARASELAGAPADVRRADLATLRLRDGEQVDAVFSNATFHWMPTTRRCSRRSPRAAPRRAHQRAVRGRGQRRGDARGRAAGGRRRRPRPGHFEGWPVPWNFAGPAADRARLRAAGFEDVRCWLPAWPVEPDEPRAYLETVCLGPHLERLHAGERERFLDAVMAAPGGASGGRLRAAEHRRAARTSARDRRAIAHLGWRAGPRLVPGRPPVPAGRRADRPRMSPTSRNAPPTAIPKSETCWAM